LPRGWKKDGRGRQQTGFRERKDVHMGKARREAGEFQEFRCVVSGPQQIRAGLGATPQLKEGQEKGVEGKGNRKRNQQRRVDRRPGHRSPHGS
jgi:hypothetical protein